MRGIQLPEKYIGKISKLYFLGSCISVMPELSFVYFEFRKLNNKRALNFRISVCKENYFKKDRGTHACIPCPKNTVSEKSGASCKCKESHYSENGLCKGKILSMVLTSLNCLLHLEHYCTRKSRASCWEDLFPTGL